MSLLVPCMGLVSISNLRAEVGQSRDLSTFVRIVDVTIADGQYQSLTFPIHKGEYWRIHPYYVDPRNAFPQDLIHVAYFVPLGPG
jgi:hypothetical protein